MLMLYTRPGCGPCAGLKRRLTTMDLPFTEVDITQDPAAAARLKDAGFTTVPVLEDATTAQMWPGVDVEKLNEVKQRHDRAQAGNPCFELGQIEADEPLQWTPTSGNLLVVGDRGSGKSAMLGRVLQAVAGAGWQGWAVGVDARCCTPGDHHVQVCTADVEDQLERIISAYELMEQRYQLIEQAQLAQERPQQMQPIVLVLDDYEDLRQRWADLGVQGHPGAEQAEAALINIARLGRAAGLHLAVACRGIAHHLGPTMVDCGSTVVHTSLWRTVPLADLAHAH